MGQPWFHLAQVNVAYARASLTDPLLAEFAASIDRLNQAAEKASGYVWRFRDAESAQADPTLLFNLSVWSEPKSLRAYVFGADHVAIMKRRREWFEPTRSVSLALWWIPADHRPSASEAWRRLEFLGRHGASPAAFTFAQSFPPPESPAEDGIEGEVRYDDHRFVPVANTANGDVGGGVIFHYRQRSGRVWATYEGPGVEFGQLVAASDATGSLDMRYSHFTPDGERRAGVCRSNPETLPDGRIRLHERWHWTTGDRSHGESTLEQVHVTP